MSKLSGLKAKIFPPDANFTLKELTGYSAGLMGNTMGQDTVGTYSEKFNRDFMGLRKDESAGVRFDPNIMLGNVSKILGFLIPPVAGAVVDRPADKKFGGSKPVLALAPVPFAITSLLLFIVPNQSLIFRVIYTFILTLLFEIADTFYDMALNAISIRMTTDTGTRKNFYTIAQLAGTIGSMLPGWILPIIVGRIQNAADQKWGYFFVALFFCVVGVSSMYAPYFTLSEKVYVKSYQKQERIKLKYILSNKPLCILIIAEILSSIRKVTYDYLPYLYQNTFDKYGMKTVIDMVSGTLSYVSLLAVPFLGRFMSSRTIMGTGYLFTAVFYGIMSLFNINFSVKGIRSKKWLIGILIGISGFPNGAQGAAKRIMIADSTEYMEWSTYKKYGVPVRSEGMVLAAMSISDKITGLARSNMYNISLNKIGYKSSYTDGAGETVYPVQTNQTLKGIFTVTTVFGLIGSLLPGLIILTDRYTGARKQKILEELADIRKLVNEKTEELNEENQIS